MKILIPILNFSSSGGGRVLSELANHWIKTGHQVDFLVNRASDPPYFPTHAGLLWINSAGRICQHRPGPTKHISAPRNLFSLLLGLANVGAHYDIILANHSLTAWPVALSKCGVARKFYYIQAYEPEYYSLDPGWKARVLQRVAARSYDLPLQQICNAPIYIGSENVRAREWIPPGVDFSLFHPRDEAAKPWSGRPIVIGCIGRREPTKGTQYILSAFEELFASDSRFRLRVAFGNLPTGWTHPAAEVVIPHGDAQLADFYRSLDILVAPGIVQLGAPHYPVMEGLACGVPLITTGYLPASPENAWIVPTRDAQAIVRAVQTVLQSPSQTQEKVALGLQAIKPYSWEAIAARFIDLFKANS